MAPSFDTNSPSTSNAASLAERTIPVSRILLCSVGLTILAGLMLPVQFGSSNEYAAEITITATGMKSADSKGSEVWVSEIPALGLIATKTAKGWEQRDQALISHQKQPAIIFWKHRITPSYCISFRRSPESGQVNLTVNGQSTTYDLYSEKDSPPLQIRPFELMTNHRPLYAWGILKGIFTLLGLFVLIHFTLLLMIRRAGVAAPQENSSFKLLILLALPSLIIYSVTLFAMWPAQMSPDSVAHWAESESGNIEDTHPAILTMTLWLVTRIWHSPSVITVLQILALTAVTVLWLVKLRELGLPRWLYRFGAVAFPLFPANFMMVTTIWKDVPYSIALTFAFLLLLTLTQTQGQAASTRRWRISFFVAMAVVMFTRHNGIPVALALTLVCAFCYRKVAGKFFLGSALGLSAALILVRAVLYPTFNVRPRPAFYEAANAIHVIAAYRMHGTTFTTEEDILLGSVHPLDRLRSLYICQSHGALLMGDANGTPNFEAFSSNMKALNILALKKNPRRPYSVPSAPSMRYLSIMADFTRKSRLGVHSPTRT